MPSSASPPPEFAQSCGLQRSGCPRQCARECLRAVENSGEHIRGDEASPWLQQPVIPLLSLFLGQSFARVEFCHTCRDLANLPLVEFDICGDRFCREERLRALGAARQCLELCPQRGVDPRGYDRCAGCAHATIMICGPIRMYTIPSSSSTASSTRLAYAAIRCRAAPLIIAAPFSAIMIVGALVLVEVTAGITEASDDAQPVEPVHPQLAVDDAHRARTHHAGAAGVIFFRSTASLAREVSVCEVPWAPSLASSAARCCAGAALDPDCR